MQHTHGAAPPVAELLCQALHQRMRMEHTAIEQHGIWQCLTRMLAQKLREMARNGRIRRIRQAKAAQRALALDRHIRQRHLRQKPLHHPLLHLLPRERGGLGAAQQLAAAAQQRDCDSLGCILRQQLLLGHTAALHQLRKARGGELLAFSCQLLLQLVGQRQIHVVAAKHQVFTHGCARKGRQAAICRRLHANQRQIRRAAAHVHHQHQTAGCQLLRKLLALQHQPVVKGCLGLFQQLDALQACELRSLQRQRTCAFVK